MLLYFLDENSLHAQLYFPRGAIADDCHQLVQRVLLERFELNQILLRSQLLQKAVSSFAQNPSF